MDIRAVYEWLARDQKAKGKIMRLRARRFELLSTLESSGMRYDRERVQTSPSDKMAAVMAEIYDIDRQIKELQAFRYQVIAETADAIEMLEDERERDLLTKLFIEKKEVKEAAMEMKYSPSHLYRVRNEAMEHLGEIIEKHSEKR